MGLNPDSETEYTSNLDTFATITSKLEGDIKCPLMQCVTVEGC